MSNLRRISYQGQLPESFWLIADRVYADRPQRPAESRPLTEQLFALEASRNDIVLYTDEATLRLVGIFPHESEEAFFGFWETMPNAALNEEAFELLRADARQRGRRRLVGPVDFNTYHRYRLRLPPAPGWGVFDREPVNPDYYPALLAGLGLAPVSTFESRRIRPQDVPAVYTEKDMLLRELAKIPFDFIPLNEHTWQEHETAIFELVQAIFGANPGYRPVPLAQFRLLYNRQYAAKLCPHTSVLFRDQASGELAALSFCHPNYTDLALPDDAPPVFERDFPRLARKQLLAKTVGVHPAYRQRGLMSYLGAYGMVHFRERYDDVIFCLMRTGNFSLHFTDGLPAETAHYALFGQDL
ncbi:hypothetical protein LJ737_24585 [Hymenobacter sp. 15J16-1T3B]|uniref:hypothetical protein n=1 Tax=Hymenobacter sp. 15J16-1T3B TaxID=2886941 RepID=UPI001D105FE4|nr:hypothetical protein [Hymenobacter sp. 15J16-1T3B]MCC3160437.1 hypothetical protein [Hymenobacter sp. 15J16-1T3B]